MSLCWKIYHFFHHKFSKNSNKPPQMHRPVIRIVFGEKKIVQKSAFSDHRGAVKKWCKKVPFLISAGLRKNGNFSHMTPPEKNHSHFFAFCQ